jgi:hypothetical protein
MGFLDKLKRSLAGGKEKTDDAAARTQKEQLMIRQKRPKEQLMIRQKRPKEQLMIRQKRPKEQLIKPIMQ